MFPSASANAQSLGVSQFSFSAPATGGLGGLAAAAPAAATYTVQAGDSPWSIAQKVYGDGSKWQQLFTGANASNPQPGNNPNVNVTAAGVPYVYTGEVLTVNGPAAPAPAPAGPPINANGGVGNTMYGPPAPLSLPLTTASANVFEINGQPAPVGAATDPLCPVGGGHMTSNSIGAPHPFPATNPMPANSSRPAVNHR
jgi:LysM repeat protein